MNYYVFVIHKDEKYIREVITYLVEQEHRTVGNDFMDEKGILSASMTSEEATILKLKFPYINLMPEGQILDIIGRLSPSLQRQMTEVQDNKDDEDCDDYEEWDCDDPYDESDYC